jgi:NAD(P)H dehydrogenase (quinone)
MSKIVVSGATGNIGSQIAALLVDKMAAQNLTLTTRSPKKLDSMKAKGVHVFKADYDSPEALDSAYAGNDVLMLISGLDVTNRIQQHRNAINAAKKAGIKHIVYTSVAGVHPRNPTLSVRDHIVTEKDLRDCGLGYTILRNATYAEVFPTVAAQPVLRTGKWVQICHTGKLAPVSRHDIALCATCCLLQPELHKDVLYEISGPELVGFQEIAALTAEMYQVPIEFVAVTEAERYKIFDDMGVPRKFTDDMDVHPDAHLWCSEEMVTADVAFQQDYHAIMSHHVEYITGKKPYTLREVYERCKGMDFNDT